MKSELIDIVSAFTAIVIFLSLRYFYKTKFKKYQLQGKQRMVGVTIVVISIIIAFILMS